jgi:hypothetical protein
MNGPLRVFEATNMFQVFEPKNMFRVFESKNIIQTGGTMDRDLLMQYIR